MSVVEEPVRTARVHKVIEEEARRMDRLFPGWEHKVNLDTLNMWSITHCVLGQVMGDWDRGIDIVACDGYVSSGAYADSRYHASWVEEIIRRRSGLSDDNRA